MSVPKVFVVVDSGSVTSTHVVGSGDVAALQVVVLDMDDLELDPDACQAVLDEHMNALSSEGDLRNVRNKLQDVVDENTEEEEEEEDLDEEDEEDEEEDPEIADFLNNHGQNEEEE